MRGDKKKEAEKTRTSLIQLRSEGTELLVDNRSLKLQNHHLQSQLAAQGKLALELASKRAAGKRAAAAGRDGSPPKPATPAAASPAGPSGGLPATQVELQALENQRLRENLLFFTSRSEPMLTDLPASSAAGWRRGTPAGNRPSMPLPPV